MAIIYMIVKSDWSYIYIYIYIYMYICIYIYIYIYIYVSIYFNLSLLGMNQFPMSHWHIRCCFHWRTVVHLLLELLAVIMASFMSCVIGSHGISVQTYVEQVWYFVLLVVLWCQGSCTSYRHRSHCHINSTLSLSQQIKIQNNKPLPLVHAKWFCCATSLWLDASSDFKSSSGDRHRGLQNMFFNSCAIYRYYFIVSKRCFQLQLWLKLFAQMSHGNSLLWSALHDTVEPDLKLAYPPLWREKKRLEIVRGGALGLGLETLWSAGSWMYHHQHYLKIHP